MYRRFSLHAMQGAPLCTLLIAFLLTSCGGGVGDTKPAGPIKPFQRLNATLKRANSTTAVTVPTDGVPSESDEPCNDQGDFFVTSTEGTPANLVNRHVLCVQDARTDQDVMLLDKDGALVSAGKMNIEVLWSMSGPSNILSKLGTLKLRYTYTPNPDVDIPVPTLRVVAKTVCNQATLLASCVQTLPAASLSSGADWTTLTVQIPFDWDSSRINPIVVDTKVKLLYTVDGSVPANEEGGSTSSYFPDLLTSPLRCDVNLAKGATKGCVFADAAAVFVIRSSDNMPRSREHIIDAFAALPGLSGQFELLAGTRALAAGQFPLTRTRDTSEINRNRRTSNARCKRDFGPAPASVPDACPIVVDPDLDEGPCDCDEFPFASSHEGADQKLETRYSVRRIPQSDNRSAGGSLGEFYRKQRVIKEDPFWVAVP